MYLLFNMLSKLFTAFLPRSKHLLISRLQSPSAIILEPRKIKSHTASIVSPSISHEVMGPDAMEGEMATDSSILAWRIPWIEEPGGLQSIQSQRAEHD